LKTGIGGEGRGGNKGSVEAAGFFKEKQNWKENEMYQKLK
jgi:hypothetical protein